MIRALAAAIGLHAALLVLFRASPESPAMTASGETVVTKWSEPTRSVVSAATRRPGGAVRPKAATGVATAAESLPPSVERFPSVPGVSMEAIARMGNALPEYPDEALEKGWEGVVELMLSLDEEGKAHQVEVARSSGYPVLDGSAEKAARGWRVSGLGKSRVRVPVRFVLD